MKTKLGRPAKWKNRTIALRLPEFMKDLLLGLAEIGDDEGYDLDEKRNISYKSGGVLEAVMQVIENKDGYFVQKSNCKAKKERQPDLAYEAFAASYSIKYEKPYPSKRVDFIKLSSLRKRLGEGVTLREWKKAVGNYFLTPQGKHTMADLCERYDTFCLYPLNEYGKPANGESRNGNGRYESASERNERNILDTLSLMGIETDIFAPDNPEVARLLPTAGSKPH